MNSKKQFKSFIVAQNSYNYDDRGSMTHSAQALFSFANLPDNKRNLFFKAYCEVYTEKLHRAIDNHKNYVSDYSPQKRYEQAIASAETRVNSVQCAIDNLLANNGDGFPFDNWEDYKANRLSKMQEQKAKAVAKLNSITLEECTEEYNEIVEDLEFEVGNLKRIINTNLVEETA